MQIRTAIFTTTKTESKAPTATIWEELPQPVRAFPASILPLARAQGIPTRLVFGHHTTHPTYTWDTEQNITNRDHWWAESYVDGKWIMTDPTVATNNKWNRNTGVWKYYGITNYTYFNPSKEQEASSHLAFRVYYNTYAGHTLNRQNEISALTRFLQTKSGGITNGRRLNSEYQVKNRKTWGDGITDHFTEMEKAIPQRLSGTTLPLPEMRIFPILNDCGFFPLQTII